MSIPENNTKAIHEELKWLTVKNENKPSFEKLKSKGITGILAPFGCAVTVGVLATGLYYLYKRDSRKQQLFMRYRVLAQGLTITVMTFGTLRIGSS